MKRWLKRHFIPHELNGFRPHFLSRKNSLHLIGIVLFFELVLFIIPAFNFTSYVEDLNLGAVLPSVLSTLTNDERAEQNLPELRENEVLNKAAQLKAEDMAAKSYFAHTSPEGLTPWHWLSVAGYSYSYAGENLAVNFVDSEDVTEAWMNSPTHKANIIHGAYTEVGTGVARGVYKGHDTIFVAQVYGRPRVVAAPVIPSAVSGNTVPVPTQVAAEVSNEESSVLGETQVAPKPAASNRLTQETVKEFFKEAAASPRHSANAVFYSMIGIITLALLFNIFIKFKHQHPDLILNGAMVMVVVLGLFITNGYISKETALTTSFLAFDAQNQPILED